MSLFCLKFSGSRSFQVERALTLWRDGQITTAAIVQDARKGPNTVKGLVKALNKITGKESVKVLAFGETNWGEASRSYMASIKGLQERAWTKIIDQAQTFAM